MDKEKSLAIVMPAVSPEEATLAMKKYQDIVAAICDEGDYQLIEGKQFRKKSGWRKIATAFNLSTEVVEEHSEKIGKTFAWHFTVKATAPNGRSAVGAGSCDAFEKAKKMDGEYKRYNKYSKQWDKATPNSIHNIRSTAESRATNRAISNLVGAGEVSAEEVEGRAGNGYAEPKTARPTPTASPTVAKAVKEVVGKCQYCGSMNRYHKKGCPGATPPAPAPEKQEQAHPDEQPTPEDYQPKDEDVSPEDIPF